MSKYLPAVLFFYTLVNNNNATGQVAKASPSYPQIKGYISTIQPIVTFDKNGHSFNFKNGYTIVFPIGINLYKNKKAGFSFEIAPVIKVANDTSKVTALVFHPGIILPLKKRFAFLTRLAFETGGRYGFTPVISKTLTKRPNLNYFATAATPVRFGNAKPSSLGIVFQFGIVF